MMTTKQKEEIVLAVAQAYYRRGSAIQYNQLSLDRVVRVTPRRGKGYAPEAATEQDVHFLDCSSFCWSVYAEGFGLELPADLTWQMAEVVRPRPYYRVFTHDETAEQRRQIEQEIRASIRTGDIMVYARTDGNGHAMLYIGDGRFMHCTKKNGEGDYDYEQLCNRMHEGGALFIDDLALLFAEPDDTPASARSLFRDNIKCFALLRPLELVDQPTGKTRVRMADCRDLVMSVQSSAFGGRHIAQGETLDYTVCVGNVGQSEAALRVEFEAARNTVLLERPAQEALTLPAGGECALHYRVRVTDGTGVALDGPEVRINGLPVASHRVLLGSKPAPEALERLLNEVRADVNAGMPALAAAAAAYGRQGIAMPDNCFDLLSPLFFRSDAICGDALYRRPQCPRKDMTVYGQFGGSGVITPEISVDPGIRTVYLTERDLMPGDLVIASDDSLFRQSYACFYDGEALYGAFGADGAQTVLTGEEKTRYIDSLFGRYAFVVLRPWQRI